VSSQRHPDIVLVKKKIEEGRIKKLSIPFIKVYYPSSRFSTENEPKSEVRGLYSKNGNKTGRAKLLRGFQYEINIWETYFRSGQGFLRINNQSLFVVRWNTKGPIMMYKHFLTSEERAVFMKMMHSIRFKNIKTSEDKDGLGMHLTQVNVTIRMMKKEKK